VATNVADGAVCDVRNLATNSVQVAAQFEEDRSDAARSRRLRSHPKTPPKKLVDRVVSQKRQFPL
jgi:hypothetical protein